MYHTVFTREVDLFLTFFVAIAPFVLLILIPWRMVVEAWAKERGEYRLGPRWSLGAAALLLPSSLSLLLVALERTDWVDYPDGGNVALWTWAGLLCLVLGVTAVRFSMSIRADHTV